MGAGLAVLLFALTGLAIYVVNPEVLGLHEREETPNPEKKMIIVQGTPENANLANSGAANTGAVAENQSNMNVSLAMPETKQKETVAKTETRQPETKTRAETVAPQGRNQVQADEPPDIEVDNKDENGVISPTNPKRKEKFPLFLWRDMSPEDRQKLREGLEKQRQLEREKRQRELQRRPFPKPPTPLANSQ
jgi:hypothetical protein